MKDTSLQIHLPVDFIVNAFYKGKLDVINIFCIPHHRRKNVKIVVVRVWN